MPMSFSTRIEVLQQLVRNLHAAAPRGLYGGSFSHAAASALEDHLADFTRVDGLLRALLAAVHEQTGVVPPSDISKRREAVLRVLAIRVDAMRVFGPDDVDAIISAALGVTVTVKRQYRTRIPNEPEELLRLASAMQIDPVQIRREFGLPDATHCNARKFGTELLCSRASGHDGTHVAPNGKTFDADADAEYCTHCGDQLDDGVCSSVPRCPLAKEPTP